MKASKTNPTKTVLIITLGFTIVYVVTKMDWAIIVVLVVGLTGISSTYLSEKIDFLWMKLAWVLSLIVPNIIMAVIFYLFLFPISALSKLFGKKDPLHLKNNSETVFVTNDKQYDKASFERMY